MANRQQTTTARAGGQNGGDDGDLMAGGGQALEKRPAFDALAPIGSAMTLKQMLQHQAVALAQILPRHVTPDRLIKTMLEPVEETLSRPPDYQGHRRQTQSWKTA